MKLLEVGNSDEDILYLGAIVTYVIIQLLTKYDNINQKMLMMVGTTVGTRLL